MEKGDTITVIKDKIRILLYFENNKYEKFVFNFFL